MNDHALMEALITTLGAPGAVVALLWWRLHKAQEVITRRLETFIEHAGKTLGELQVRVTVLERTPPSPVPRYVAADMTPLE